MLTENVTEKLPSGDFNEKFEDSTARVESFDAAVSEAKKDLEKETNTQQKRGRGRPRKIPDSQPGPAAASQTESPPPTSQAEVMPQMDFKPLLKQGLKTPFKMWANKAGCPALELTDEEIEAPATYADMALNYYAPRLDSMDPGKAAITMFSLSMLMLVAEKSAALNAQHAAPAPAPAKSGESKPAAELVTVETARTPMPVVSEETPVYGGGGRI